jgi:pimeloyl-ACP methyl ester carboxylesterase
VNQSTVTFFSDGGVVAADLYFPDKVDPGVKLPAVISCTGFTGIRLMMQPIYGKYFTDAGFAFLAFDYRGWGGSSGERGRLAPLEQVEDTRNAITYMQDHELVDPSRIGLFGVSFGALIAPYTAAIDDRVKCVLAKGGVAHGLEAVTNQRSPAQMEDWKRKVLEARRRRVFFNEVERSLNVLDVFVDAESHEWLEGAWEAVPQWRTYLGFDSIGRVMDFRPIDVVARISPRPVAMICALRDTTGDPKSFRELFEAAAEPKRWHGVDCGHYGYYSGPLLDSVMDYTIQFFRECL